jgi:hypothetical protein
MSSVPDGERTVASTQSLLGSKSGEYRALSTNIESAYARNNAAQSASGSLEIVLSSSRADNHFIKRSPNSPSSRLTQIV